MLICVILVGLSLILVLAVLGGLGLPASAFATHSACKTSGYTINYTLDSIKGPAFDRSGWVRITVDWCRQNGEFNGVAPQVRSNSAPAGVTITKSNNNHALLLNQYDWSVETNWTLAYDGCSRSIRQSVELDNDDPGPTQRVYSKSGACIQHDLIITSITGILT